jgi:hypothetical protein
MIIGTICIYYFLVSFIVGCVSMSVCTVFKEDISIFFDPRKWSNDNFEGKLIALFLGYVFMAGLALCYWIYRFCVWVGN